MISLSNIKTCSLSVALAATVLTGCNKLDEVPDNRTEIDSPEKVGLLLVTAYPKATPALMGELSGDNYVDDNIVVSATNNSAYEPFHDEIYQWKDVTNYAIGDDDTPYQVWEEYYAGIARCNSAIEAMLKISSDPANDPVVRASWGEAHALRAYLHFVLLNTFGESYKGPDQTELGVPYVTIPEVTVDVDYSTNAFRHTIPETYDLIWKDLQVGIDCIEDGSYLVKAYHFNRNTAYAFAARFFLYKRDWQNVIKYANLALGSNPASMLRSWSTLNQATMDSRLNDFNNANANCNFLIQDTYSLQDRMLSACKYAMNGSAVKFKDKDGKEWGPLDTQKILLNGGGPNWSGYLPCFTGNLFIFGGQQYGIWMFRIYEYFEYTDKIAGIGYVHILYQPFTAEETLLCRAEAELYLGQTQDAINDLVYWTTSKMVEGGMTQAQINNKYNRNNSSNIYVNEIHPAEVGFAANDVFIDNTGKKPQAGKEDKQALLDCILHFRRIETMYEGLRWNDIKRYGMKIYHHWRNAGEDEISTDSITWNDKRRVFEVPNLVRTAGYPSMRDNGGQQTSMGYGSTVHRQEKPLTKKPEKYSVNK